MQILFRQQQDQEFQGMKAMEILSGDEREALRLSPRWREFHLPHQPDAAFLLFFETLLEIRTPDNKTGLAQSAPCTRGSCHPCQPRYVVAAQGHRPVANRSTLLAVFLTLFLLGFCLGLGLLARCLCKTLAVLFLLPLFLFPELGLGSGLTSSRSCV